MQEAGPISNLSFHNPVFVAFCICASVMVLRVRKPDLQRNFRTPAVWVVAPLGIVFSLALIYGLPWITFERFIIWMALGLIVYFAYGIRHSKLNR